MMNGKNFSPHSKVWIYQSSRTFNKTESEEITDLLNEFTKQWTAHNLQLEAAGFLFEDRVIVLMVDETHTDASGCSIDKSVHFIKDLENKYGVELFNRMLVNYFDGNRWQMTNLQNLSELDKDALVIDPLVSTKFDFDTRFVLPLKNTWMMQYLS